MLQIRIDRNVEVVTCLLNLTERGSLDWNTGISSQPYRREVMQHFSHLKKHPAVLLTNQLHAQGFWWDAMIELAVTCTVFPEAALTADLRNSRYVNAGEGDPAKGKKTLDELLDLIDDFYIQAEFDDFYRAHQPLYDGIIREVEAGLPDAAWLQLVTDYYGAGSDEDIQGFYLIPSPLSIGGNGFGPEVHRDGELEVYNVFAPFRSVDAEEASCGFDRPEQLAKLAMHEFGHSFVNHALEPPRHKGPITRFAALYAAERATGQMGYEDWICVAEHIIRACEIRIALVAGQPESAARLLQHNIEQHAFHYLPAIVEALDDYEQNRSRYPSLSAFVPTLMQTLDAIAADQ
ncbi:MAG: DUF4932 domain-containing protein [Gemmatimonadetes bacterium]|jgi:hypothetical protein|nr:DUF4932 domain-containing protein [Gemmatimonadota bacterium]MBT5330048.1 DUF4932 domain-containing protein [Gemmatimonadota bacterium]MBT5452203.1 DUF4932 domain-containing protein [Gemmatimonadota bacterium]MBT5803912.1 DUF4932 domain-containing protein [Gemmatimonadota bacterium]MBT6621088.1 DUF4932 domain-containing protein [Gemmatimonadota bacterium]